MNRIDPTSPVIEAQGLSRRKPGASEWMLDRIDLRIESGERLALVGSTGAGKSLLLRSLALLDPIDRGQIRWHGKEIAAEKVPSYRTEVLYLQQQAPVVEGTVRDNLSLPFSFDQRRRSRFSEPRAVELLAELGRGPEFLEARSLDLSGGERQLVALVRALLAQPRVLLLDEPTASLDRSATGTLERLVERWYAEAQQQRAWVWVSHDQTQAERMADRVLELEDGRWKVHR